MKYRIMRNGWGDVWIEEFSEWERWEPLPDIAYTCWGITRDTVYFYTVWGAKRYLKKLIKRQVKAERKNKSEVVEEIEG